MSRHPKPDTFRPAPDAALRTAAIAAELEVYYQPGPARAVDLRQLTPLEQMYEYYSQPEALAETLAEAA
ncbi:hypothetical protein [Ruixingdingia sedimenti]|uniref:Uncharacterized protein n=1 Tax=Ruixingdingia sedimenti TaxID=3073604 RepID=A0ABU1F4F4_9RHOB|nr:hypothetical protein [Xinfangfangia sp. LG-4]MDR5651750.1 hypothetical protein [Xinfangfangia sp. LG-4]